MALVKPNTEVPRRHYPVHIPLLRLKRYCNEEEWLSKEELRKYTSDYLQAIEEEPINWKAVSEFSFIRKFVSMKLSTWHIAYIIHSNNGIEDPKCSYSLVNN